VVCALVAAPRADVDAAIARAPRPPLTCSACVIVDDRGHTLFARSALTARPNASTTKIVTALVVRHRAALDEVVTVSPAAAATGGGGLDLDPGDRYSVDALLHALLMTSSNEAAVALAEHSAGSHARFVALMNERAEAMGARATHFVTAHGLDAPEHYSCARDLARFGLRLLDDPVLARIVGTSTTTIEGPAGTETLDNRNVLLESYRGATGVKTGYTALAGDVLVASATRSDRTVVVVTMGASSDEAAAVEATALLDRGWQLLARTVVTAAGRAVATLYFDPAGATEVVTGAPVRGPWRRADVELSFEPDPAVAPPLAAGDAVGEIAVSAGDEIVARVPAVVRSGVAPTQTSWGGRLVGTVLRALGGLVPGIP
jgi:D-alanyl-D-alanine carboxypeptidase (penicillin-binding protein 5/6)